MAYYLLAGLLNVDQCLNIGKIFRLSMDVSSLLNKNISAVTTTNNIQTISVIVEEYNIECMIKVVQSLTNEISIKFNGSVIDTNLNNSQLIALDGSNGDNKMDEYILIPKQKDILKTLQKSNDCNSDTPSEKVVLYYLYDSLIKINDLLDSVNRKNIKYKNSYVALSKPDYTNECAMLKMLAIQLKERLKLYKIVKK
jgi:hypothetical protein